MTTFYNEYEYEYEEDTEHNNLCCALLFIAEAVNIYNWYLRREDNPQYFIYDETNESKHNLYVNIMNSENKEEVLNKLRITFLKLSIILYDDDYTDLNKLAMIFVNFIHNRQKRLHETGEYLDSEYILSYNLENNNHELKPTIYLSIRQLEKFYINIIFNTNIDTRKELYNHINTNRDTNYSEYFGNPTFGDSFIFLEVLYLTDEITSYLNNSKTIIEYSNKKVEKFECPICYEEQTSKNICVTTKCGHQYCEICFRGIFNNGIEPILCPMCRCQITQYTNSKIFEDGEQVGDEDEDEDKDEDKNM